LSACRVGTVATWWCPLACVLAERPQDGGRDQAVPAPKICQLTDVSPCKLQKYLQCEMHLPKSAERPVYAMTPYGYTEPERHTRLSCAHVIPLAI
jgi:hypothetical protein